VDNRANPQGVRGLTAATIGGVITWVGLGLIFLTWERYKQPAIRLTLTAEDIAWLMIAFGVYTIGGAAIGLAEGIAFYFVRYLLTLPKLIRLRAERSARANSYPSTIASHDRLGSSLVNRDP
jgi:nitrate reductase gamma subunit